MTTPLLELPVGARARGRAHGETHRDLIRRHLDAWFAHLDGGRAENPRAYLERFVDDTDFLPAICRWTPDLAEEVEGIAEGAGQPARHIWALQMLDEEWAYAMRCAAARQPRSKCSTFAVAGNGRDQPTLVGQNMDLGGYTQGLQVLMRVAAEADRPACLIFSLAGMIALMGVNSAGVAVHVNTLSQLPSAPSGLPVAFVVRGALERRAAAEAAAFVTGAQHASGQHYLLADNGGIRSLESSAAGSTSFAGQGDGRVLHTNHPLADGMREASPLRNSVVRLECLQRRLGGASAPGLADAKAAMSSFDDPDHPVCRLGSGSGLIVYTTGSMISTLGGAGRPVVSEISVGPPNQNTWRQFRLDR
ncbi:MAG TPA: C45 family peptidase [Vineibacter sp.]|nr:C45 family peptidase [Vineibacter sp.]